MINEIIPPKLTVDPTSYAEGQKVAFIKGIRGYTGMSLKEAKEASEDKSSSLVLHRRAVRDPELESKGIETIKQAGVKILTGGINPVIAHLEEAVRASMDAGFYDVAGDIINILKGCK